jgi:hypothetical protein
MSIISWGDENSIETNHVLESDGTVVKGGRAEKQGSDNASGLNINSQHMELCFAKSSQYINGIPESATMRTISNCLFPSPRTIHKRALFK